MKTVERIFVKLIIIHFLLLIGTHVVIHELNLFPNLKLITKYEGVGNGDLTKQRNIFEHLRK